MASEAIQAAKLRIASAENGVASASQSLKSAKTQVQMASQMLESAKSQKKSAQSQMTSSEKELADARDYLKSVEKKWQVIDVDLDSGSEGNGDGDGGDDKKKPAENGNKDDDGNGKVVSRNRKERGSTRERMPHVIFSDRLEAVRSAVEGRANAGPFLKAVPRSIPKYYKIILEPIDLATIRKKNRNHDYKTADKFVADFELMKINAIKFNGKGSALANDAVEIWQFVKTTVEQNREEFKHMEEAVRDQPSEKKTKKAKSKAASS